MAREDCHTMDNVNPIGLLSYFRGADVWVTPADMTAIAARHGRTIAVPTLENSPAHRAASAAKRIKTMQIRIDVVNVDRVPATKVPTDAKAVEFGVLRRVQVTDHETRWEQYDSAAYSTEGGWSTPASPEGREFVEAAIKWQTHLTYSFVRNSIVLPALREMRAFQMGGSGVMYIPGAAVSAFRTLQAFIADIPGSKLHGIRIDPTDPESVAAVASAAQESLTNGVAEVVERLATWREQTGRRRSSLDVMVAELSEIREQAASLAGGLRLSLGEIEAAVNAAAADVQAAIDEQGAKFKPTKKPAAIAKVSDDALLAELIRRGLMPAPVAVVTPAIVPAPVVEALPPEPEPAPEPEVKPEVPSVEDLETMPTPALRKLAKGLGVAGWATKSDTKLVVAILEIRNAA